MKSMVMAGAVAAALSLTALSQQRAAAQCCQPDCRRGGEISINSGITFGVHWTPCHGHWEPNCPQACCPGAPYGYPGTGSYNYPPAGAYGPGPIAYGYAPPANAGAAFAPPQPAQAPPQAAPTGPVLPMPKADTNSVQNVGYTYPAAYGYDYGYGYGYWYGYPYYQAPNYGYGYGR